MPESCDHIGTGTTSQIIGDSKYIKCRKCGATIAIEDAPNSTKRGKRPR